MAYGSEGYGIDMVEHAPVHPDATLAFVGDVMLGRLVNRELQRRDPEWFWGDVLDLLKNADAVFANLECAITTSETRWRRSAKEFHFRADPRSIAVLKAGNVRFVSLANNHLLDFETRGLLDTIRHLDEAGIAHAGAGGNVTAAAAPAFVQAGKLTVAAFAVTDNMPEAAAGEASPGICYVDPQHEDSGPTQAAFAAARNAGADLVVVSAHLGPNMLDRPSPAIRAYKRRLAARGAHLIHGHSAHVVQGLERIGASLILHDAGDIIDDYAIDPDLRNDLSFIFLLDVTKSELRRVRLVPVRLYMAQVRHAPPDDAAWICNRMQALSRHLGVDLRRTQDGLQLDFSDNNTGSTPARTEPEPIA